LKLLLDTHIWLWSLLDADRLRPPVASALTDPDHELMLSPISVWEAHLLGEKGRVVLRPSPPDWIATALRRVPLREAPLTTEIAIASRKVSLNHPDPADRFIAATAIVGGLTLVTGDRRLFNVPELDVLANR